MANVKYYHQLRLGEKFVLNNKTYEKVKPVMKSCCSCLYNSVPVDAEDKQKIVVQSSQKVEVVGG